MLKKLSMLLFVVALVSACASNSTKTDLSSSNKVYFDFDQIVPNTTSEEALKKQVEALKADTNSKILIEGYADVRGSAKYNKCLALKRAKTVKNYLVSQGIEADRIEVASHGSENQIASENGKILYKENRVAIISIK